MLDMSRKLYGQHLAADVVGSLVESHTEEGNQPAKALVLSFHGWTGVGKNYLSTMIANRLYRRGLQSKFVKMYIATVDFQSNRDVYSYKVSKLTVGIKSFVFFLLFPKMTPKEPSGIAGARIKFRCRKNSTDPWWDVSITSNQT